MKIHLLLLALALVSSAAAEHRAPGTTIYVAPNGNNQWSGRLPSPNPSLTDGPVATLDHARAVMRRMLQSTMGQEDTLAVVIRGGTYPCPTTLRLAHQDGGTANAPVLWTNFRGEKVRLIGGAAVPQFTGVKDSAALRRIRPDLAGKILQADLRSAGINDYGTIAPRGNAGMELFFRGERMQLARWPNAEWQRIADVPQYGDSMYNKGLDREKRFDNVPVGRHYGRITYDGERPGTWSAENDILLHGYWTWDWSDSFQKVKKIDPVKHEITIAEPHHGYGYTKNQRYYFLNILEELDTPGEWYMDQRKGLLFFYPPAPVDRTTIEVSLLEEPIIQCDSTSHLILRGVSLESSRGNGVRIIGGRSVVVDHCTFRNLGSDAVAIERGKEHSVRNSEIEYVARGGIYLAGGNRLTLEPSGHVVFNTAIHHYSRWLRTGGYAVVLDGVGHRVEHCLMHNAPFEAVYIKGNEHLIEYNEIHSVMQESGDAGAIHTGRDWTWRGNVVRYNYFHDLKGPGLHGVMGMYMDDWASGFTVFGNIFYRAGRATLIGGGRDNTVENNLYVECSPSIHLDARGLSWAGYYFDGTYNVLFEGLNAMHHTVPPYSTRYPELASLPGPTATLPMDNRIIRNASMGGRWMDIYDYLQFDKSICTFKDNVVADPIVLRRRADGQQGWDPYYLDIDTKEGYVALRQTDPQVNVEFPGDTFVASPPLMFDPERRLIMFPEDSPLAKVGFKRLPFGEMGLLRK
jgi:hypothetical protein